MGDNIGDKKHSPGTGAWSPLVSFQGNSGRSALSARAMHTDGAPLSRSAGAPPAPIAPEATSGAACREAMLCWVPLDAGPHGLLHPEQQLATVSGQPASMQGALGRMASGVQRAARGPSELHLLPDLSQPQPSRWQRDNSADRRGRRAPSRLPHPQEPPAAGALGPTPGPLCWLGRCWGAAFSPSDWHPGRSLSPWKLDTDGCLNVFSGGEGGGEGNGFMPLVRFSKAPAPRSGSESRL